MNRSLLVTCLAAGTIAVVSGLSLAEPPSVASKSAAGAGQPGRFSYPQAKKIDQVDDYFGTKVADPYRWLEDPDSPDSRKWIEAENAVTQSYLAQIPERDILKARLKKLWDYEKFGMPHKEAGKYFYSKNSGLQNHSVVYVADSLTAEPRVLLDPNTWSSDGTVSLAGPSYSEDAKYAAYGKSDGGSDWNTWYVRDVATGKDLPDELKWVKFSGASWTKDNKGFFYSRYDEPKAGSELRQANYFPKVYYHVAGTPQSQDALFYERPDQKEWGIGVGVTEDGKYAVMSLSQGTDPKNRVFVRDLAKSPLSAKPTETDQKIAETQKRIRSLKATLEFAGKLEPALDTAALEPVKAALKKAEGERATLIAGQGNTYLGFVEVLNDFDASYNFIENEGTTLFFHTDLKAPRGKVIAIDLAKPDRAAWKDVIPEAKETLQGVSPVGGKLTATYLKDAYTQTKVFDTAGKFEREVKFPGMGTAGGFGGKKTDTETFYSYTSFTVPPSIFRYDTTTGQSTLFKQPTVDFKGDEYVTEQKFYTSKDGTRVPMFITYKKGTRLDGTNPTLLYGYGGFNIPMTPGFSITNAVWLEEGGVYAVANMRGGGEYGEDWHQAGTKLRKQNVFDDFIAAGEYLVKEKYTNPAKLGVFGGSNGGLLIGAVVNQRPDLFGAAVPAVGVMDMLRFHTFTIGWAWKSDYGSSEDPDQFKALYAYSPLHNIKPGTKYPAVMVTTGDHDDRVVPAHSFKYAATLQAANASDRPTLIRIETRAGHGAGKPTEKQIEEAADRLAFFAHELKITAP